MKKSSCILVLIHIFVIQLMAVLCVSKNFDFFYFVQSWPGSYCDTKRSCCYPTTGKPAADFGIHGLWPNNNDGSYPSNCDPNSPFDPFIISNLTSEMRKNWPTLACPSDNGMKFWKHEWEKHGTCSVSVLDQEGYFAASLNLKKQVDLLSILKNAGIQPDGSFYSLTSITKAIQDAIGFTPGIECNMDASRNSQLYEIYICVDNTATNIIECPILPRRRCSASIEFPYFGETTITTSSTSSKGYDLLSAV